jgi:hypothetical protein
MISQLGVYQHVHGKQSAVTPSEFLDGALRKVFHTGLLLTTGIPTGVIMVISNFFVGKMIVALKVRSQLVYRNSDFLSILPKRLQIKHFFCSPVCLIFPSFY